MLLGGSLARKSLALDRPVIPTAEEATALRQNDDDRVDLVHAAVVDGLRIFCALTLEGRGWREDGGVSPQSLTRTELHHSAGRNPHCGANSRSRETLRRTGASARGWKNSRIRKVEMTAGEWAAIIVAIAALLVAAVGVPVSTPHRSGVFALSGLLVLLALGVGAASLFGRTSPPPDSPSPLPPSDIPSSSAPPTSPPSTSTAPSAATQTREVYIAAVDDLCLAHYEENYANQQRLGPSVRGVKESTVIFRSLAAQWSAIERPVGDEQEIEQIIDLLRQANDASDQALFAHANSDGPAYNFYVQRDMQLKDQHGQAARSYGHKICGSL